MNKKLLLLGTGACIASYGLYKLIQQLKDKSEAKEIDEELLQLDRYLSQKKAEERRQMLNGDVNYSLALMLGKGDSYSGVVSIEFEIKKIQKFFIDYQGKRLIQMKVNGKIVSDLHDKWNKYFIVVGEKDLKEGKNKISILFENDYAKDGDGLHSMMDTDGLQYLYSNLEPAYCRKWFPCLDQPDIRATLELYSIIHKDWVAISNEIIVEQNSPVDFSQIMKSSNFDFDLKRLNSNLDLAIEDYRVWSFIKTKSISTYIFCVCAGPYKQIKGENTHKNIPMSLYCRESSYGDLMRQKHVYFEVTNKCMVFYEEFFHCEYPFSKYDHIFCPQFNCGAMENAGAVTFADKYIFKDQVDKDTRCDLVITITHELCHMWFGNLVTMKWWNDLWLNESFADFLSYYACEQFQISFDNFDFPTAFNKGKDWGYSTDMSNATHSIAGDVIDTQQAETIFDGITYSKGSACLKQMMFLLTPAKFSKALGYYFSKYQYQNTTLDDFIQALSTQFQGQFTLEQWKKQWIETPGCNSLEPIWYNNNQLLVQQDSVTQKFTLNRYHKIKIALFKDDSKPLIIDSIIMNQQLNYISIDNLNQYQAVLLNYDDYGFCKIIVDNKSFKYFTRNLKQIDSVLNQNLLMRALFEMIKDAKLTSSQYMEFVVNNIQEIQTDILSSLLSYLDASILHYSPLSHQDELNQTSFEICKDALAKMTNEDNDREIILKQYLITFGGGKNNMMELLQWFTNDIQLSKSELTYYEKWDIVKKANESAYISRNTKNQVLLKQLNEDNSEEGQKNKLFCEAAVYDEIKLDYLWSIFLAPPTETPLHFVVSQMQGFNIQSRNLVLYHQKYFDSLEHIFQNNPNTYAKRFYDNLFPITDDFSFMTKSIEKLINKIDQNKQNNLYKKLLDSYDYVFRRRNCCSFFLKNL